MNAEFQRIAGIDKKALFSGQCKEIEENNRMRKTRDLFKKSGDNRGILRAKVGTIKDRKVKDLTEARLRRGGKNAEKNCTKMIITTGIGMMLGSLT